MRHSLRGLLGLALVSCIANFAAPALASDLISVEAASRAGLTRGWFTQVQINRSNGRLLHITQHVSDVHNQQVFEVVAGTELYRYADRDRDAFGEAFGRDGAKARATDKYNELEAQGKKPVVKNYVVPDVVIYAVTDRGLIQAINGETGQTLWAKTVGNADYPTTNVAANDTHVAVCNGSKIYVLDRRDGTALWQREATGVISAGPAVTDKSVSVPMVSGSVETFRTDTQKRYSPYIYRSQGIIYTQPIMTPRNSMAWATERGHMYVAEGSTGKPRFRLEASDTIIGGVAYLLPKYFYVASFDGYVYCLDEVNGSQLWRYSCGSSVSRTPVAVGETVYVVTDEGQLHALDYKTGRLKNIRLPGDPAVGAPVAAGKKPADDQSRPVWPVVSGVRGVLAVSPTKLYCLGGPEQLAVLDANSGARLSTLPIGPQSVLLHNSVTDRLIVANATGLVQCFYERELAWPYGPYVHVNELEKLKAKRPDVIQEEEKPMEEAPVKPMPKKEVDPFGGGEPQMEADPFGGGPAKPMPMPKPKVEDDPFG